MAFNSTLDQSFITWTLLLLTGGTEYFFFGRDFPEPCTIFVSISLLTTCQYPPPPIQKYHHILAHVPRRGEQKSPLTENRCLKHLSLRAMLLLQS